MEMQLERKLADGQSVEVNGVSIRNPSCYDRANSGALVVMDEGDVENVKCVVYLFDDNLTMTLKRRLPAAPAACSIQPSGSVAVVATLKPDDTLYALDVNEGTERWSRPNHANEPYSHKRPQITDLSINDSGRITVYTTGVESYHLTADGALVEQDQNERELFRLLDEENEDAVGRVRSYLNDTQQERNLKAILELELRLDRSFIRDRLDAFVPGITKSIERHEAHKVDLTDPDAPKDLQKLMSAGKRLIYEAAREQEAAIDPAIEILKTHLKNQPAEATHADQQQLKRIVPGKLNRLLPESDQEVGCDSAPPSDMNQPLDKRKEGEPGTGCGCMASVLVVVFVFSTAVLWITAPQGFWIN